MADIRPIDANALLKRRRNFGKDYALDPVDKNIDDQLVDLRDVLNAPTLDYAPVRHGEWDEKIVAFCNVCSVCKVIVDRACLPTVKHKGVLMPNIGALNYCPNCGAKMDGCTEDA